MSCEKKRAAVLSTAFALLVICESEIGAADDPKPGAARQSVKEGSVAQAIPLDIRLATRRVRSDSTGTPTSVEMWRGAELTRQTFFPRLAGSFRLTSSDRMVETRSRARRNGAVYSRLQQTFSGISVEGAVYTLIEKHGRVIAGVGRVAPGLKTTTTPAVTEAAALAAASNAIGATRYRWESEPQRFPAPRGTLVLYSGDLGRTKPFVLAWRFRIGVASPARTAWLVHVDAISGAVIDRRSLIHHADTQGLGASVYGGGPLHIVADSFGKPSDPSYRLREATGRRVSTFDLVGDAAADFVDDDNNWKEPEVRRGATAHWAAERFWDLLAGLSDGLYLGPDGQGVAGLASYQVEAGHCANPDSPGPYFDELDEAAYLCNGSDPAGPPDVDLETVAHEFTHAVALYSVDGGFGPDRESQALEEGFGDIMATSANALTGDGADSDWTLFEQSSAFKSQRSLANPNLHRQPDTYGGDHWADALAAPNPHVAGGVPAHWFYLLAHGGEGTNDLGFDYHVPAIGREDAARIAFLTLTEGFNSQSRFADARVASVLLARAEFDDGSLQELATAAAWDAVGVTDDAPTTLYFTPPDGAVGIEPWSARLGFRTQPSADEAGEWLIEVSSDPDFTTDVQSGGVSFQTAGVSGITNYREFKLWAGTPYFWRVKAKRRSGWDTRWTLSARFETAFKQPRNVQPTHDAEGVHPWPVTVAWETVHGATGYQVEIAEDDEFSQALQPETVTETSAATINLKVKHGYFVRVRAHGPENTGYGEWSTQFHGAGADVGDADDLEREFEPEIASAFTTDEAIPVRSSPAANAVVPAWDAAFRWHRNGAKSYELAVSTSAATPSSGDKVPATSDAMQEDRRDLEPLATYYWWVRGKGYFGDFSPWSPTLHKLTTADTRVRAVSPGADSVVRTFWPVTFRWGELPGAEDYEIEVAGPNDATFANDALLLHHIAEKDETAVDLDVDPSSNTPYYWRVRAFGPEGQRGPWSNGGDAATQRFTIRSEVDLVYPGADSSDVPINGVPFRWARIEGARSYDAWITDTFRKFPPVREFSATGAETAHTWTGSALAHSIEYEWGIRAIGPNGMTGVANSARFTTEEAPPPPPKKCNTHVIQGGDAAETHFIDVVKTSGNIGLRYEHFNVEDNTIIKYEGKILRQTGCVKGNGLITPIGFNGTSHLIEVVVEPNCFEKVNTRWDFLIICP